MNEFTSTAEVAKFSQSDKQIDLPIKQPFNISKEQDEYVLSFKQDLFFEKDKVFYNISVEVTSRLRSKTIPTEDTFFNLYALGVIKAREKANEKWQSLGFTSFIDWPFPQQENVKQDIQKALKASEQTFLFNQNKNS